MTQAEMTFTEHLSELRTRLTRAAIAIFIGFFIAYNWHVELFQLVAAPLLDGLAEHGVYKLQALQITETIIVYMKVSLVAAVIGVGPYILWQLWGFVGPGLLPQERKWILPIVAFSSLFFFLGLTFAYKVMVPFMTGFLVEMTQEGGHVEMLLTISNAFSFSLVTLLLFGIIFELPLVIFFLAVLGIVTHRGLIKFFRYFVVIAFIVGAILTPPDPISQTLMAVPVIGLYAIGILIAWLVGRRRAASGELKPIMGPRLWGTVALAMAFIGGGIWLLVDVLRPHPHAVELVPKGATFAIGGEPSHLGDARPDAIAAFVRALKPNNGEALAAALASDSLGSIVLLGDSDGLRAVVVDGAAPDGVVPAGLVPEPGEAAHVLEDDTLVYGAAALVEAVVACHADEEACLGADPKHAKRLEDLRRSGPGWLYAPDATDEWRALFPNGGEAEAASWMGAVLRLDADEGPSTVWSLGMQDGAAARALRSRILGWREQQERDRAQEARSVAQQQELTRLVRHVIELAATTGRAVEALKAAAPKTGTDERAWLAQSAALSGELDRLRGELLAMTPAAGAGVAGGDGDGGDGAGNLIETLGEDRVRSWDVTTDEDVVLLAVALTQSGLRALLSAPDPAPQTLAGP